MHSPRPVQSCRVRNDWKHERCVMGFRKEKGTMGRQPQRATWIGRRPLAVVFLCAVLVANALGAVPARATTYFWNLAFERQWQVDEAVVPGFWGPLRTSTARNEPYAGHGAGSFCPVHSSPPIACDAAGIPGRSVEYFDKGRMEVGYTQGGPREVLTNGRLVAEMENSRVQTGDTTFEHRPFPTAPLVGDPGNAGPTYADLFVLPERDPDTGTPPPPFTFDPVAHQWAQRPDTPLPPSIPPPVFTYTRIDDPNGAYGQYVLTAFADYMARVPSGFAAFGWPLSPVFVVEVPVNGVPTVLVAQAFECRVLVYDATQPAGQEVDSTRVGRDYYEWRYGANDPMRYGPPGLGYLPPRPTASPTMPAPTFTP